MTSKATLFSRKVEKLAVALDDIGDDAENENYHGYAGFVRDFATALRSGKFVARHQALITIGVAKALDMGDLKTDDLTYIDGAAVIRWIIDQGPVY